MCELKKEDFKQFKYGNREYITWYEDECMRICFSDIPDVRELKINKFLMSDKEIKNIKKKPYKLYNEVFVLLEDKECAITYTFEIPKNYRWDGASIPSAFWFLVGAKGDVRFLIASLVHDVLCENHSYVENDRYFADKVFERCCYVGGTCAFIRWAMFHSVDNYQKFCKWSA